MSSISDALKRAQQERDRLRAADPASGAAPAEGAPEGTDTSLASVVLKKHVPPEGSGIPTVEALTTGRAVPATPLTDAIRQAPATPPPAVVAQQKAADTIVEDYASKHRLNLPSSMVVYHERSGAIAEQYRKIRDGLMQSNPKRDPQMLVVTSSVAGEGKTTTVINLGLSLVEVRANRVLLIDGCLTRASGRRRGLTDVLKLHGQPGLVDLLTTPVEDVQPFIKATPWNNLFVLPAGGGTAPVPATELLKSPVLRQCLRQLRVNFDWVLIDAPPALTLPHAGLLAGSSDGILLAVAMHHTASETAQTTTRRLKSMNLPVKACILTRA
jgi:Mrp family chromosome partitioning ATPase